MVHKGNTGKAKNSNSTTARQPPAAAAAEAGPVQMFKDREEVATVGLLNTYPLQSDADSLIGGTVDENSDALSDVSMITNPGDYGELLPDCMIVDPLETLPEELFDVSDLLDPNLSTPEVLPDIQPPQSSCSSASSSSSYVPVVMTHRTPLTNVTNTITPDTLTAAAYTANALATGAGLTSQLLLAALAGRTEGENANGKSTAPNHQLCERQDRCSIFTVLCYFRYFVRE